MLTPEQRADLVHEAMYRGHGNPLGDGGPEAVAEQIRAAVAEERERCAKVLEQRLTAAEVTGDPWVIAAAAREAIAAIRDGKPAAPQWTREVPTVPGWYWFRADATRAESLPHVVHVHPHPQDGILCVNLKTLHLVRLIEELPTCRPNAIWSGPLESPQ